MLFACVDTGHATVYEIGSDTGTKFRCDPFSPHQQQEKSTMDWNRIEGNWKQAKGKVKEQWGKLTDDDLDQIAGKRDQLEGKIQERYGIEKDRIKRDIDDWSGRQTW
jgi:uncharacterized protein YjbJ (UPF0337 family)